MAGEIKILPSDEVAARRKGSAPAAQYVTVLRGMEPGQGGEVVIEEGTPSRQTVKNRLRAASAIANVTIQFIRSPANTVLFEVFPPGTEFPKRKGGPGRPRKNASPESA